MTPFGVSVLDRRTHLAEQRQHLLPVHADLDDLDRPPSANGLVLFGEVDGAHPTLSRNVQYSIRYAPISSGTPIPCSFRSRTVTTKLRIVSECCGNSSHRARISGSSSWRPRIDRIRSSMASEKNGPGGDGSGMICGAGARLHEASTSGLRHLSMTYSIGTGTLGLDPSARGLSAEDRWYNRTPILNDL